MTQKEIKEAIKNASDGINQYIIIMDMLGKVNVSNNAEFQRLYNGFYRMRQLPAIWYQTYYSYLENNKNNINISFDNVLDELYQETAICSPSYSSKLVATINPNKPIWDKYILQNISLTPPRYGTYPARIPNTRAVYQSIVNWYADFLPSDDGRLYIEIFNRNVPVDVARKITDVKKVDFILWKKRD